MLKYSKIEKLVWNAILQFMPSTKVRPFMFVTWVVLDGMVVEPLALYKTKDFILWELDMPSLN